MVPESVGASTVSARIPLSFLVNVFVPENKSGEVSVNTLPAVTSIAPANVPSKIVRAVVTEPPATRNPCVALFVLMRNVPTLPKAPSLPNCSIPPVTSKIVFAAPKVFAVPANTSVPTPDFVNATAPAALDPPEIVPLSVSPCTTFESDAVATLNVAPEFSTSASFTCKP